MPLKRCPMSFTFYIDMNDLKVHVYVDRQQDVRATEIDKVDMHSSFRPGDTVRALVVSFSDSVLAIWELG